MKEFETVIEKKMHVRSKELLDCLFSRALLIIDYVQKYLKLSSRQTASKYLKTLAKLGYFEEEKLGYNLKDPFATIVKVANHPVWQALVDALGKLDWTSLDIDLTQAKKFLSC